MGTSHIEMEQIVNPTKFQKIQDDIALASELAIITVDYLGKPITKHSNCSEFCKKVRASKYRSYCEKCDSYGGLEAARIRKPFIYICHVGIVDFAIPIIFNDLYLGAFMAGQVLLSEQDNNNIPERILLNIKNPIIPQEDPELFKSYSKLTVMSYEKIIALANMLSHIGNYCVKEAQLKELIASVPKQLKAEQNDKVQFIDDNRQTKIRTISKLKNESHLIIQPALSYIIKYPQEKITLEKMAALCNISTSYFSKLFAKENLGNLSDYVNQIKMEHAKELITETDWPIRTIAENLGYDDSGYFIKVFRKNTGITPLEFRKKNNV